MAVLSLHEHAYLGDKYGVWSRKQYAKDWWRSLDWRKIK
jgi:Fe-Mn family superoxide dismutase